MKNNFPGVGEAIRALLRAGRAEEPRGSDEPAQGGDPGGRHAPGEPHGPGRGPAQHRLPRDTHRVHKQAPQAGQEGESSVVDLLL